jgi:excisionase family DNA binding protein
MPAADGSADGMMAESSATALVSSEDVFGLDAPANDEVPQESPGVRFARLVAAGVVAGGRKLMEMRPSPEVMSVDEAALFLGVDRNTVYDAAGRGEIPHRRIGKRILLSRTQLVAWLGACKAGSGRNG